jgi:hypothetical protein
MSAVAGRLPTELPPPPRPPLHIMVESTMPPLVIAGDNEGRCALVKVDRDGDHRLGLPAREIAISAVDLRRLADTIDAVQSGMYQPNPEPAS